MANAAFIAKGALVNVWSERVTARPSAGAGRRVYQCTELHPHKQKIRALHGFD